MRRRYSRQSGVAAIEFVFVSALMLGLISTTLLLGRVLAMYNVQQKAIHNAVRYLALVTPAEVASLSAAAVAANTAISLVRAGAEGGAAGTFFNPVTVACQPNNGATCGGNMPAAWTGQTPATVGLSQYVVLNDLALLGWTEDVLGGRSGVDWTIDITAPYGH